MFMLLTDGTHCIAHIFLLGFDNHSYKYSWDTESLQNCLQILFNISSSTYFHVLHDFSIRIKIVLFFQLY
jgi:hypothetical protein